MKVEQHYNELKNYLPEVDVIELQLQMAVPGSIVFCFSIARIAKEYNSTQENEDVVCEHLKELCKIHFKND